MPNIFEILNVERDTTPEQIEKLYKKRALKDHPDKPGGNEERYKILQAAMDRYRENPDAIDLDIEDDEVDIDVDITVKGTNIKLDKHIAPHSSPYSARLKSAHKNFIEEFKKKKLTSVDSRALLTSFKSDLYSNHYNIFDYIKAKQNSNKNIVSFRTFKSELNPTNAVELFSEFLKGEYVGSDLNRLSKYFESEIEKAKQIQLYLPQIVMYEGISSIITMAAKGEFDSKYLLESVSKIVEFAQETAALSDSEESRTCYISVTAPLIANKYFRHLFMHALNSYWQQPGHNIEGRTIFDGQEATKAYYSKARNASSKLNVSNEDRENLRLELGGYYYLYQFEKEINKLEAKCDKSAKSYRKIAYQSANWIMTLSHYFDTNIIVNLAFQTGIYFQQASNAIGSTEIAQMADEKLALDMYMQAFTIVDRKRPDLELYVLTNGLKAIANLKFAHEGLAEFVKAKQERCTKLADIYPIYVPFHSNIKFIDAGHKSKPIFLMRYFLNEIIKRNDMDNTTLLDLSKELKEEKKKELFSLAETERNLYTQIIEWQESLKNINKLIRKNWLSIDSNKEFRIKVLKKLKEVKEDSKKSELGNINNEYLDYTEFLETTLQKQIDYARSDDEKKDMTESFTNFKRIKEKFIAKIRELEKIIVRLEKLREDDNSSKGEVKNDKSILEDIELEDLSNVARKRIIDDTEIYFKQLYNSIKNVRDYDLILLDKIKFSKFRAERKLEKMTESSGQNNKTAQYINLYDSLKNIINNRSYDSNKYKEVEQILDKLNNMILEESFSKALCYIDFLIYKYQEKSIEKNLNNQDKENLEVLKETRQLYNEQKEAIEKNKTVREKYTKKIYELSEFDSHSQKLDNLIQFEEYYIQHILSKNARESQEISVKEVNNTIQKLSESEKQVVFRLGFTDLDATFIEEVTKELSLLDNDKPENTVFDYFDYAKLILEAEIKTIDSEEYEKELKDELKSLEKLRHEASDQVDLIKSNSEIAKQYLKKIDNLSYFQSFSTNLLDSIEFLEFKNQKELERFKSLNIDKKRANLKEELQTIEKIRNHIVQKQDQIEHDPVIKANAQNILNSIKNEGKTDAQIKAEATIHHERLSILYQAYEASLSGWYQDKHNTERDLRLELIGRMLESKGWNFDDLEKNLDTPWLTVDRDDNGWIKPTTVLPIEDDYTKAFSEFEGYEVNHKTGEINFFMKEYNKIKDKEYKKLFTIYDLEEMLERKITGAFFSLDPIDPDIKFHPFNKMRFEPSALYETQFLNAMLLTDYMLKFMTQGQEVQGRYPYDVRHIFGMIQHLPPYLKDIIYDISNTHDGTNSLHRFWIEAIEVPAVKSEELLEKDGIERVAFGNMKMIIRKHKMTRDLNGNLIDKPHEHKEGWQFYVLPNSIKLNNFKSNLPAIIITEDKKHIYFFDNDYLSKPYSLKNDELVNRLIDQPRDDTDNRVLITINNHIMLYRAVKQLTSLTKREHHYSKEYVFAKEFSDHYDEFAQYLPIFGQLRELSKISAAIGQLASIRKNNRLNINYTEARLEKVGAPIVDKFNDEGKEDIKKVRKLLSKDNIQEEITENLRRLSNKIGSLDSDFKSDNVAEKYREIYLINKRKIIDENSYSDWRRFKTSTHGQKQLSELKDSVCTQIRKQRREYSDELYNSYKSELGIGPTTRSLVNKFLDGDIYPLAKAIIDFQYNKQREPLLKALGERRKLDEGFNQIGMRKGKYTKDLSNICLQVPANVSHTGGRLVYGGVRVQPKITHIEKTDPKFVQLQKQAFGSTQVKKVSSANLAATRKASGSDSIVGKNNPQYLKRQQKREAELVALAKAKGVNTDAIRKQVKTDLAKNPNANPTDIGKAARASQRAAAQANFAATNTSNTSSGNNSTGGSSGGDDNNNNNKPKSFGQWSERVNAEKQNRNKPKQKAAGGGGNGSSLDDESNDNSGKKPVPSQSAKGPAKTELFNYTKTGRIKEEQLPREGKVRFHPRDEWNPNNPDRGPNRIGFKDRYGNVWVQGPSRTAGQGFEWDVQLSAKGKEMWGWASRDGKHLNVSLDGKITHR